MPGGIGAQGGLVVQGKPTEVNGGIGIVEKLDKLVFAGAAYPVAVGIACSEVGWIKKDFVDDKPFPGGQDARECAAIGLGAGGVGKRCVGGLVEHKASVDVGGTGGSLVSPEVKPFPVYFGIER